MQNWSKNGRKSKIMKFAATVDWIKLVDGVGLAVASGSRLDIGTSQLDHA